MMRPAGLLAVPWCWALMAPRRPGRGRPHGGSRRARGGNGGRVLGRIGDTEGDLTGAHAPRQQAQLPGLGPARHASSGQLRGVEAGVGTVNVTATIRNVQSGRAASLAQLGWVHTGRVIRVSWPQWIAPGRWHLLRQPQRP